MVRVTDHDTDILQPVAFAKPNRQFMKQGLQIFGLQKSEFAALRTPHLVLVACNFSRNFFKLAPCRLQLCAQFFSG